MGDAAVFYVPSCPVPLLNEVTKVHCLWIARRYPSAETETKQRIPALAVGILPLAPRQDKKVKIHLLPAGRFVARHIPNEMLACSYI
ncbi:MAG TPA: hypothetical protein VGQ53_00105 [Chitinophagaceae bacterium]|jgi:hypothetical protein|nr:hypothetical protein [Chitinophagaceae bacterium]